jgi:hypothetical protein
VVAQAAWVARVAAAVAVAETVAPTGAAAVAAVKVAHVAVRAVQAGWVAAEEDLAAAAVRPAAG